MDNVFDEIFKIVESEKCNSKKEFGNFISNLTNHPSPLREAVAYKLEDIYSDEFLDCNNLEILLNAITDINPNVSRCVCRLIKDNKLLKSSIEGKIIKKISTILKDLSGIEFKSNKSHAKNKILFSLYWLLEALYCSMSGKYNDEISKILHFILNFSDYTIREKGAQILTKIDNPDVKLIDMVKSDTNFYVNFYTKLYKK